MPFQGMPGAAIELEDPARHVVQEVAVVGDGDDGARELLQELLEPGHRLGVEVVGGLVEQEHVVGWSSSRQSATRRRSPPESVRHLRVARGQAQGVHGHLDVAVQLPEVLGVDLVLQAAQLVRRSRPTSRRRAPRIRCRIARCGATASSTFSRTVFLSSSCGSWGRKPMRVPVGREGLAREVLVHAGHDAQQRALAGPVAAQDADLGRRVERQPDALQDLLALRRDLAEVLHGEDVLRCHVRSALARSVVRGNAYSDMRTAGSARLDVCP